MNARNSIGLIAILWVFCSFPCLGENAIYKVVPNKSGFPYPTMLPDVSPGDRSLFDWKRYLEEAASPADKAYRASEAPPEFGINIPGGDSSNSGEHTRARLAAEELAAKCAQLENAFRERLRSSEPAALKTLEAFIENRKLAMNAEVELIGGSWGGSGAKTAWATARMNATLNYLQSLRGLKSSLHFQDMPE